MENGNKCLIINSPLDDGSTQTYLNTDIAAKYGLHGEIAPVEFTLSSMNGQVNTVIEAATINDVTGDLKTIRKPLIGTGTISVVLIPHR